MTLLELSPQYRDQAQALKERIALLEGRRKEVRSESERLLLARRLCILQVMHRQARELAGLTEHYYERGYRRNGKYTL